MMRTAIALLIVAVVAAAQAPKSPCALLTKAEVQEALGGPASDGTLNATQKSICDFKVGDMGNVSIMLTSKGPADSAEKTVAELKKRSISGQVVPGFGDSAYAASPGYGMQQLGVFKGSSQVVVTVMVFGAPEAKAKAITQALMRKALPRVP